MRVTLFDSFILAIIPASFQWSLASRVIPRSLSCTNKINSTTLASSYDAEENLITFNWPTELKCDTKTAKLTFFKAPPGRCSILKVPRHQNKTDFPPIEFNLSLSPCKNPSNCSNIQETIAVPYVDGCYKLCLEVLLVRNKSPRSRCSNHFNVENKTLSFSSYEKEFKRQEDQKIFGTFEAEIEPKLKPAMKVYVQINDEANHNNRFSFEQNKSIVWDNIEVQKDIGIPKKSANGKCILINSAASALKCNFGKLLIPGDSVGFKVLVLDEKNVPVTVSASSFKFKISNYTDCENVYIMDAPPDDYVHELVLPCCILALIILICILPIKKSFVMQILRREKREKPTIENSDSHQTMGLLDKSKLNLKILLIYSKKFEDFKDAVDEFKFHLCTAFESSEVIDLYQEDYEQQLNIHGLQFITRLTREEFANPNVKIILIHSDDTERLLQKRGDELAKWEANEEPILIVYQDLTENPCHLKYNKVYNVCLEKFPLTDPRQKPKLNSLTTYHFPKHYDKLCRDLCKVMDPGRREFPLAECSNHILPKIIDYAL